MISNAHIVLVLLIVTAYIGYNRKGANNPFYFGWTIFENLSRTVAVFLLYTFTKKKSMISLAIILAITARFFGISVNTCLAIRTQYEGKRTMVSS